MRDRPTCTRTHASRRIDVPLPVWQTHRYARTLELHDALARYPIRSTLKHSISDPSDISRVREPARNNGVQLPARHVSTRIRRNRERAAAASEAARRGTVGTNPALRTVPTEGSGYAGVRRHGNRRPASDKGQNEWRTVSAHARDGRNPQWDRTVSDPA